MNTSTRSKCLPLILILFAVVGLAPLARAQNQPAIGTITASGCVSIDITGQGIVGISITNSQSGSAWSGTIQPEISIGGDAAQNTNVTPYGSTTAQATITANGIYNSSVVGGTTFYLCGNTVTNTANVKLNVVKLAAKLNGGGSTTFPLLGSAGAIGTPTYSFSGGTNYGMFFDLGNAAVAWTITGVERMTLDGNGPLVQGLGNGSGYCYGGSLLFSSRTTCLSSPSAGVASFDTTAAGNGVTKVKAAGYISTGTTFTSSAGLNDTALTGGATAGKFTTATLTSGSTVITMGNTATAPNGWHCSASDITHPLDVIVGTTLSATQATLTVATAITAADVIEFSCIGF